MVKYQPKKVEILVAMARKGFNQQTLSKVAALDPSTISLHLNEKRKISPTSAMKIADALDCEIEELFEIQITEGGCLRKE